MKIHWLDEPEQHDYTAALSYLSLHFPLEHAAELVHALRAAPVREWKAKDVIRASGLEVLDEHNSHVAHNLKKIEDGKKLSPILLARVDGRLLIADGFHRACTIYLRDEDAPIPAKIAGDES
ncbi:hypothetical protein [Burkholderia thailandensis]|uniref:hypothetical protein n=1 Tax=Burkholderia thailandensis TaxID=57975 RepID=UPI00107EC8D5|nr:hypothetical protein [Burkholderia thailandensis]TGB34409.1 hypothetical protein C6946_07210 [Burkholderia thailandensis]